MCIVFVKVIGSIVYHAHKSVLRLAIHACGKVEVVVIDQRLPACFGNVLVTSLEGYFASVSDCFNEKRFERRYHDIFVGVHNDGVIYLVFPVEQENGVALYLSVHVFKEFFRT